MTDWWQDQNLKRMVYEEAEKGNAAMQCELAAKLLEKGQPEESLSYYKRAAAGGSQNAMFNLGILYMEGRPGIEQNGEQAFFWFDQGARAGDAEAMYMAARFLLEGFGCLKNEELAAEYLETAVQAGFTPAAELLFTLPGKADERERKTAVIEEIAKRADVFLQEGDYAAAIPHLTEAADKSVELFGEADACTTGLLANLAFAYAKLQKYDESIPLREKIVSLLQQSMSVSHPKFIIATMNLSADYGRAGRLQSALQLSKQAYLTTMQTYPVMDETRILCVNRYAADLMAAGKFTDALEVLQENLNAADRLRTSPGYMEIEKEDSLLHRRLKRTKALYDHLQSLKEEHREFFSLPEHRRSYAWICAELMEMLENLPEEYLEKLDPAELDHYREQALLATCYEKKLGLGDGVESDPYTDALQALISLKYMMPSLASCQEECEKARVRAQVTWVKNELSLILTVLPTRSYIEKMTHAQPVDFLKSLNALADGKQAEANVVKLDEVFLSVREAEGERLEITFTYADEAVKRQIVLTYDILSAELSAPEGFSDLV